MAMAGQWDARRIPGFGFASVQSVELALRGQTQNVRYKVALCICTTQRGCYSFHQGRKNGNSDGSPTEEKPLESKDPTRPAAASQQAGKRKYRKPSVQTYGTLSQVTGSQPNSAPHHLDSPAIPSKTHRT